MSNPYAGTGWELAWDQGYSYGWYYPNDTEPEPPSPFADEQAAVYREGAYAGRIAVAASQQGGMTGNADGAGYSTTGAEEVGSERGPITIGEVTVVGDPNAPVDPNSTDDAYAVGYNAGYQGELLDDSAFGEAAKSSYHKGYNEGGALRRTSGHEHSGAAEVAHGIGEVVVPVIMDHRVLHSLLHGIPLTELLLHAISPGGDTMLHPPEAYLAVCYRDDHGLNGDAVFDGGAWHGVATLELSDAQSEARDHASQWEHDGAAHIWVYGNDDEWNPDVTLDPG